MFSQRAEAFLKKQPLRRDDAIRNQAEIEEIFSKNNLQISQPLLDFQTKHGGLTIKLGMNPLCFGIIHLHTTSEGRIFQPFYHKPEEPDEIPLFQCADTTLQVEFSMDLQGRFYEDFELVSNSFEGFVEDQAMFNTIGKIEGIREVYHRRLQDVEIDISAIKKQLNLDPLPDYPDDLIKWFSNGTMYVRSSTQCIKVYSGSEFTSELRDSFNDYIRNLK
ncbi:MAG: hypothetical protein NXI20_28525 [bacterium]|nr:hypothetical protein [bacterium]